jgi:hypothetical protein
MFERQFLTLLGVSVAAAGLFAWGAAGYHQRDQLQTWATTRCAAAGEAYAPPAQSKDKPGQACAGRIDRLVKFERDTNSQTAGVLLDALNDQTRKTNTDAAKARTAAEAAAAATKRMEAANAAVKDDQVGGDWFGALNQSAGLRAPER